MHAALHERGVAAARVLPASEAAGGGAAGGEAAGGGGGGQGGGDGEGGAGGAGGAGGVAGGVGVVQLELLPEANAASSGDTVGGDAVASAAAGSVGLES